MSADTSGEVSNGTPAFSSPGEPIKDARSKRVVHSPHASDRIKDEEKSSPHLHNAVAGDLAVDLKESTTASTPWQLESDVATRPSNGDPPLRESTEIDTVPLPTNVVLRKRSFSFSSDSSFDPNSSMPSRDGFGRFVSAAKASRKPPSKKRKQEQASQLPQLSLQATSDDLVTSQTQQPSSSKRRNSMEALIRSAHSDENAEAQPPRDNTDIVSPMLGINSTQRMMAKVGHSRMETSQAFEQSSRNMPKLSTRHTARENVPGTPGSPTAVGKLRTKTHAPYTSPSLNEYSYKHSIREANGRFARLPESQLSRKALRKRQIRAEQKAIKEEQARQNNLSSSPQPVKRLDPSAAPISNSAPDSMKDAPSSQREALPSSEPPPSSYIPSRRDRDRSSRGNKIKDRTYNATPEKNNTLQAESIKVRPEASSPDPIPNGKHKAPTNHLGEIFRHSRKSDVELQNAVDESCTILLENSCGAEAYALRRLHEISVKDDSSKQLLQALTSVDIGNAITQGFEREAYRELDWEQECEWQNLIADATALAQGGFVLVPKASSGNGMDFQNLPTTYPLSDGSGEKPISQTQDENETVSDIDEIGMSIDKRPEPSQDADPHSLTNGDVATPSSLISRDERCSETEQMDDEDVSEADRPPRRRRFASLISPSASEPSSDVDGTSGQDLRMPNLGDEHGSNHDEHPGDDIVEGEPSDVLLNTLRASSEESHDKDDQQNDPGNVTADLRPALGRLFAPTNEPTNDKLNGTDSNAAFSDTSRRNGEQPAEPQDYVSNEHASQHSSPEPAKLGQSLGQDNERLLRKQRRKERRERKLKRKLERASIDYASNPTSLHTQSIKHVQLEPNRRLSSIEYHHETMGKKESGSPDHLPEKQKKKKKKNRECSASPGPSHPQLNEDRGASSEQRQKRSKKHRKKRHMRKSRDMSLEL